MENNLDELKTYLYEADYFNQVIALLEWDQVTNMPPAALAARGRQLAAFRRILQEKLTSPEIGRCLDALRPYEADLPPDDDDAALLRITRRNYERDIKVPADFWARVYQHSSESLNVWLKAREADDFPAAQPYLQKMLDLSRELANYFPGYEHIADPLIAFRDYGETAASLRRLFSELHRRLTPLIEAIARQPLVDNACLFGRFPVEDQVNFVRDVIVAFGFDFERGRLNLTLPRLVRVSPDDARILVRVDDGFLDPGLFSTMHEAGHALYELGIGRVYHGTPLGRGTSDGMHEGQSLLWEAKVGRSLSFWKHYFPKLQAAFPQQLGEVSLDTFYRAVNRVKPSLRRLGADEVTYNLHVMIRFELELELLDGSLAVKDLPQAWHAKYQKYLGIQAGNDRDGALQDVHWYAAPIGGAFQSYTLGNIFGAILMAEARKAHPEIDDEMARGRFGTLHSWLKNNIYRHGSKYTASELVARVSGGPMTIDPFIDYLKRKYGQLYQLQW